MHSDFTQRLFFPFAALGGDCRRRRRTGGGSRAREGERGRADVGHLILEWLTRCSKLNCHPCRCPHKPHWMDRSQWTGRTEEKKGSDNRELLVSISTPALSLSPSPSLFSLSLSLFFLSLPPSLSFSVLFFSFISFFVPLSCARTSCMLRRASRLPDYLMSGLAPSPSRAKTTHLCFSDDPARPLALALPRSPARGTLSPLPEREVTWAT